MSKSPEKMKAVKDRLFHAAMELFEERGYENTTVADITQKAGVSKGTFFTHFPSKDAIFSAIGKIFTEYMQDIVETGLMENHPARRILLDCINMADEWCEENKRMIMQVLSSGMHRTAMGSRASGNRLAMDEMLIKTLKHGQKKGEISASISAEDAASMMVGLYFAITADWIHDCGTWSLKDKLTGCLDILFQGIAP